MRPAVIRTLRFCARNGMLNWRYALLLWRYLARRLLTSAGRRWQTDGLLFLGRGLELQIARQGKVAFGRFVWIGDGTKIRCHEGVVEIGAKTVMGQECTISAYQRVRIGEQCVIADRAMFIDFDHGVVEVERPIRVQGIYKRDVEVGSNVWIGYGACILRGVRVGDNSIVGTNSVVTKDVPANAVVAGIPARVIRMREAPKDLRWRPATARWSSRSGGAEQPLPIPDELAQPGADLGGALLVELGADPQEAESSPRAPRPRTAARIGAAPLPHPPPELHRPAVHQLGYLDQDAAPVSGVGDTPQVAFPLEPVDDRRQCARWSARPPRRAGRRRSVRRDGRCRCNGRRCG